MSCWQGTATAPPIAAGARPWARQRADGPVRSTGACLWRPLPYAVLLDEEGRVASLGLINSREHLESLFEAKEHGVASIQDYLARRQKEA
jgi:hypothetical protein